MAIAAKELMEAIGIHVFAGLFTEGVKQHFSVPAVINDGYGDHIHLANHPEAQLFRTDEFDVKKFKNIDFVYAQPPCAPWSVAGNRLGIEDPRMNMTADAMKIALALKPEFFVLESVVRAFSKGKDYYDKAGLLWQADGYSITHMLINGAFTGTPQIRNRYLFIAHRNNIVLPNFIKGKTVSEALHEVQASGHEVCSPGIKSTLQKYGYSELRPGDKLHSWFTRVNKDPEYKSNGEMLNRPSIASLRLDGRKHAPVVVGDYSWIHHKEDRPITINELKALCGLRLDYSLENATRWAAQEYLGKSVMPKTGSWIADMASKTIRHKSNMPHSNVIDLRKGEYEPMLI